MSAAIVVEIACDGEGCRRTYQEALDADRQTLTDQLATLARMRRTLAAEQGWTFTPENTVDLCKDCDKWIREATLFVAGENESRRVSGLAEG